MPLRTLSGLICSEQIVEKFGIQNSPFLLSCKISEYALPVVIELHLDLGGDKVLDELFPVSTKFDYIRFAITCLTGGDIHGFVPKDYDFKPYSIIYNSYKDCTLIREACPEINENQLSHP